MLPVFWLKRAPPFALEKWAYAHCQIFIDWISHAQFKIPIFSFCRMKPLFIYITFAITIVASNPIPQRLTEEEFRAFRTEEDQVENKVNIIGGYTKVIINYEITYILCPRTIKTNDIFFTYRLEGKVGTTTAAQFHSTNPSLSGTLLNSQQLDGLWTPWVAGRKWRNFLKWLLSSTWRTC